MMLLHVRSRRLSICAGEYKIPDIRVGVTTAESFFPFATVPSPRDTLLNFRPNSTFWLVSGGQGTDGERGSCLRFDGIVGLNKEADFVHELCRGASVDFNEPRQCSVLFFSFFFLKSFFLQVISSYREEDDK